MHKTDEARALALKALNEAPPAILFRKPLDYVLADHLRQRMFADFSMKSPRRRSGTSK